MNKHKKNFNCVVTGLALAFTFHSSAQAYSFEAGGTTANVYGYAKLNVIYDRNADLGNSVDRNKIRLDGQDGPDGNTRLHAFESRIGFSTSTLAGASQIKTRIEGDFFGGGGGDFRLRHAYGEWNGLLAGQTWTNFGGFLGLNPNIDFTLQPGQANAGRQAQLRYSIDGLSIALEDPGNLGKGVLAGDDKNQFPDLTMRYKGEADNIEYGASAMLRRLEYDNTGTAKSGKRKDSDFGWGLNLEASAELSEWLTLRGSLTHGDGIGGYLEGTPTFPAYRDPATGKLETIKATGGTVGFTANVGPGDFTLGYGLAKADLDKAVAAGAVRYDDNERMEAMHMNYIWSPIDNVNYGVEVGYHKRKVVDGRKGDALRLQGMVQYSF